ncbi:MAG TPA: hypothetical protein QGF52_01295 [Nitrososphaerales archaeon]|nr:hypothetical protein [Nitrososphaerales archaeon]
MSVTYSSTVMMLMSFRESLSVAVIIIIVLFLIIWFRKNKIGKSKQKE